jgi:hypothetical protein
MSHFNATSKRNFVFTIRIGNALQAFAGFYRTYIQQGAGSDSRENLSAIVTAFTLFDNIELTRNR